MTITVGEFIEALKQYPQDMPVAYEAYSEYNSLSIDQLRTEAGCLPRNDGWVANPRPDKEEQLYLVLPGN